MTSFYLYNINLHNDIEHFSSKGIVTGNSISEATHNVTDYYTNGDENLIDSLLIAGVGLSGCLELNDGTMRLIEQETETYVS